MKQILFNTEMVRAILDNRKTVTRRVAFRSSDLSEFSSQMYPNGWWFRGRVYTSWDSAIREPQGVMSLCKYHPSDILYVRETFFEYNGNFYYKAEGKHEGLGKRGIFFKWNSPARMPRKAARIFLRVTDVRIERLQDIMDDPPGPQNQIVKEGCKYGCDFAAVWDRTIKPDARAIYGWKANPWVWVIEFERIIIGE